MYAYYKAMPSQNPLVSDRMYRRSIKQHKKKLKAITAHVDNKPPHHWRKQPKRNLKREQMVEERLSGIERENRILLEKMARIMKKNKSLDNLNTRKPKSLNREFRQRELERITEQNLAILKRIQGSEPTYSHLKWSEERKKHEGYLKNIVLYKKGPCMKGNRRRPNTSQSFYRSNKNSSSMPDLSSLELEHRRPNTTDLNFRQPLSSMTRPASRESLPPAFGNGENVIEVNHFRPASRESVSRSGSPATLDEEKEDFPLIPEGKEEERNSVEGEDTEEKMQ